MTDAAVAKYLARHAEPEAGQLAHCPGSYRNTLVVPLYREPVAALRRLCTTVSQRGNTLLIAVCNRPAADTNHDWFLDLRATLAADPQWTGGDDVLNLFALDHAGALLLVDRVQAGAPLPEREGVGLARKLGNDIACRLIDDGRVESPWIANTDADVELPADYFAALDADGDNGDLAAVVYPFRHVFRDACPPLPTLLYEFSLHHYVEGLRWAGSPYAFQTLGSTLAVNYRHYARVRGFPKRAGAEDFYLLNKLAKTGAVASLAAPQLCIRARHSTRVPFGTGPATQRIHSQRLAWDMPLYHPAGFAALKTVLALLRALASSDDDLNTALARVCAVARSGIDADHLQALCEQLKMPQAVAHARRQGRSAAARHRHLNTWFDGFRTLKLLNRLRDHHCGSVTLADWHRHMRQWQQPPGTALLHLYARIEALTCPVAPAGE